MSKQWKQFLTSRAPLWSNLDLSHARRTVSPKFIRECIRRSQFRITAAKIHRLDKRDILRTLATACKGLESLEFLSGAVAGEGLIEIAMCASNLKTLKLSKEVSITLDAVTQVLRHRPSLRTVEFLSVQVSNTPADWVNLPNLESLTLRASVPHGPRGDLIRLVC